MGAVERVNGLGRLICCPLFIYSNEFFDALGSKQFIYDNGEFHEIAITKDQKQYKNLLIRQT